MPTCQPGHHVSLASRRSLLGIVPPPSVLQSSRTHTRHFTRLDKRVNRSFQEENIRSSYNNILEEILNEIISLQTDSKVKGTFRWNKEFIVTTIKSLLKTFLNKSYSVFDNLDSNTCIQIYDFLIEFNDIGPSTHTPGLS